jgi:RNA polymerase sigma factor (sigma-70 family)
MVFKPVVKPPIRRRSENSSSTTAYRRGHQPKLDNIPLTLPVRLGSSDAPNYSPRIRDSGRIPSLTGRASMATLPPPPGDLTPEQLFLAHLKDIEEIIAHACRRSRFSPQESQDFGQDVMVKLIEDDYAVFRKYQGRSTVKTYLTVVINRFLLDYQNKIWQKWRPSAEAERLGRVAMRLETLTVRDGQPFDEACRHLREEGYEMSENELAQLRAKLPDRSLRRFVGEEQLQVMASRDPNPAERLLARERAELGRRSTIALYRALAEIPKDERLMVLLRTELSVADIARKRRRDAKPLYRELQKIYDKLRKLMERQGVRRQDVEEILDWLQPDLEF